MKLRRKKKDASITTYTFTYIDPRDIVGTMLLILGFLGVAIGFVVIGIIIGHTFA